MAKSKKELIEDQFESITDAANKLGLTRRSVYKIINADKITTRAKNMIIASGYSPETFESAIHGEN